MAPFTISPHHPLLYQCALPQEAMLTQSKTSPESSSDSPGAREDLSLTHFLSTSIVKIRVRLWRVLWRVTNFCMSVTELLGSKMFFMSVGKNMAMSGELKEASGLEALERPGCQIGSPDMKDPEMKVVMELDEDEPAADERESSVIDSDEEEDDGWESDEETNEEEGREPEDEDSEWSDEDDEDSEASSAESLELWESFLNRDDPYNPLSFCSSISSRTNTQQSQQTQPPPTTRPEECEPEPKPDSKEGAKKVCFSDQVTVHPLPWSLDSWAARDGSCWMQMARDRERFRRRAESFEPLLKPCLSAEHRAGVWERLQRKTSS